MDFDPFKYKISELNTLQAEKGLVLVAEPFMDDPYFKRSVVLIAENNAEGTVGFNLTQGIDIQLQDLVDDFPAFNSQVYLGGPVQAQSLFYIHSKGDLIPNSQVISDKLYWAGDFEILVDLIRFGKITENDIRFFLGYSGWDKGQLDRELKQNSWFIADINSAIVLKSDSNTLWKDIIKNSKREISYMANFPEDPNLN